MTKMMTMLELLSSICLRQLDISVILSDWFSWEAGVLLGTVLGGKYW
jgi:hypothetical protein